MADKRNDRPDHHGIFDPETGADRTAVGRTLRALREMKGWQQSDLADASGIYPSKISQYETGKKKRWQQEEVERCVRALGVNPFMYRSALRITQAVQSGEQLSEESTMADLLGGVAEPSGEWAKNPFLRQNIQELTRTFRQFTIQYCDLSWSLQQLAGRPRDDPE